MNDPQIGLTIIALSAVLYLPHKLDRIRKHRRAVAKYRTDNERELGEALAANVAAYDSQPSWMQR